MKQSISPAAVIAIIVVIIAVVCFFGFRAMRPDSSRTTTVQTQTKMSPAQEAQYQSMHSGQSQTH